MRRRERLRLACVRLRHTLPADALARSCGTLLAAHRSSSEPIPADARNTCKARGTARRPARAAWHLEIEQPGVWSQSARIGWTRSRRSITGDMPRGIPPRVREGMASCSCALPWAERFAPPFCLPVAASHALLLQKRWLVCIVPQRVRSCARLRFRARMLGDLGHTPGSKIRATPSRKGPWMPSMQMRTNGACEVSGCLPCQKPGGREALRGRERRLSA